MGMFSALTGLFGFRRTPKPARHKLSDISEISISCVHMDFSFGYSFRLHRDEEKWLFDAECFTNNCSEHTGFENRSVSEEDVKTLLEILERNNSISYAENYKKPPKSPFKVLDETTYVFCLAFSDGSRYMTKDRQAEPEQFFYGLAEKKKQ